MCSGLNILLSSFVNISQNLLAAKYLLTESVVKYRCFVWYRKYILLKKSNFISNETQKYHYDFIKIHFNSMKEIINIH